VAVCAYLVVVVFCGVIFVSFTMQVVQKDCKARNLNREDAMDRGRWKKLIKIV